MVIAISVALSVAIMQLLPTTASTADSPAVTVVDSKRIAALEERVDELVAAIAPLRPERITAPRSTERKADTTTEPYQVTGDLNDKIRQLEANLAALRNGAAANETRGQPKPTVEEARQTLATPAATDTAKVAAHERLRRQRDAYTPAMIRDLVRIGLTNPDPKLRADIWRCFDGATHLPQIVPHLIQALANDGDARVRNEAAETLGDYATIASVRQALEHAYRHDPDKTVREKAGRTVGGELNRR